METAEQIAEREEQERLEAERLETERRASLAASGSGDDDEIGVDRGDEFTPEGEAAGEGELSAEALAKIAAEETATDEKTPPKHVPYERLAEKVRLVKVVEENLDLTRQENERLKSELAALKGEGGKADETKPQETDADKLKGLKAEYRQVLKDVLLDPADDTANARMEELEGQISEIEERIVEERVTRKIETKSAETTARINLQSALEKAFADYPFLDHTRPDANAELNDDILFYKKGLMSDGKSEAEALLIAINKFAPAYAREHGFAKDEKDGKDELARKRAQLEREALERNAAASVAQPANLGGSGRGARSSELTIDNVAALDEKAFDNLPESELKKARGD